MKKIVWGISLITVVVVTILTFYRPSLMLSPGKPLSGHHEVEHNCQACHPFGPSEEHHQAMEDRCIECHKLKLIGVATVAGHPIMEEKVKKEILTFHARLKDNNCKRCHLMHLDTNRIQKVKMFYHRMLSSSDRVKCASCHTRPKDQAHLGSQSRECLHCHNYHQWDEVTFDHRQLSKQEKKRCHQCHQTPRDQLHSNSSKGKCLLCHDTARWSPSTFEHQKHFRFNRKHKKQDCKKCHEKPDYRQYSCYGCHAHNQYEVKEEHHEEGIYKFEQCTQCHRSGNKHETKKAWKKLRKKKK